MKTKIFIATLILSLSITVRAYADTTPSPTSAILNQQINQLKDKIASQVSKLNLVEKRGVIGTIQDTSTSQITLTDMQGNIQYVDLDEITKYSSAANSSFGLSDLQKGMEVSVLGIYNKESQRILGRFIDTVSVPNRYYGEIASIDNKNFDITLTTTDGKSIEVEIDTTSTLSSYTPNAGLIKYGFSKLSVGDRVEVIGYPDKTNSSLILDDRLIDYLSVPKIPNLTLVTPTAAVTPTSSSKGAKTVIPAK